MSILKDLDPQYAKLHSAPLLRKRTIWGGVALLTLGSVYWFATQATTKADYPERQAVSAHNETPATLPEKSTKENTSSEMPQKPSAAAIRDESIKAEGSDQQTGHPVANTSRTQSSAVGKPLPLAQENRTGKPLTAPTQKAEHAKQKPSANQTVAKNEKTMGNNGKKSTERDIDIISAIVR